MAATIDSKIKQQAPPDALSCVMVDHANARTLFNILDKLVKGGHDEESQVEKLVHTIMMTCRMSNQARFEVLLPLVEQLSEGKTLAKKMKQKVVESEKLLEKVDASKKHLDNKEFIKLLEQQKKGANELMEMEESEVLPAMLDELDMDDMVQAAERMEQAKLKAPLMPQAKQFA